MAASLLDRCTEAIRWVWTRDEVEDSSSVHKIIFTIIVYGGMVGSVLLGGGVLLYLGHPDLTFLLWLFGISLSFCLGALNVVWDIHGYRAKQREDDSGAKSAGEPDRALSPDLQIGNDAKFGFLATVVSLTALIIGIQFSLLLASLI